MDRKIKLLAVTSVAAITTAACTPQGGANAPHNQQTAGTTSYAGSTTSPVTHSHSGKVHAHLLPATGIRHTHTTGSGATGGSSTYTPPSTTYRPPANTGGSGSAGMTHSHSGKVHTHRLPATGINHTHRVGGGSAPAPTTYRPPVATGGSGGQAATQRDPNAHSHNGRVHSHRLPASGLNHAHNTGAATSPRPPVANNYRPPVSPPANNYRPPANNTYRPPAGNNSGGVAHNHNGRTHSHRLPASGMNHGHNTGATTRPTPRPTAPQTNNTNSGSSYYDYSNNNTAAPATNNNANTTANANTGNSSYYDYSSGGSSTYYNTAKPKGSANTANTSGSNYYDYSAPSSSGSTSNSTSTSSSSGSSSGSFAPNNYSGGNAYTVQRGDTVFQVMRNTGVYWKDIIRMNNLKAPNYQIVPGQRLKLR